MVSVFICEDIEIHRKQISKYVQDYIKKQDYDMEIVVSTDNPDKVLNYLKEHNVSGLYFLDVDFEREDMDGIKLGSMIRKHNPLGCIVFITAHDEIVLDIFRKKIEAMEFIVKDRQFNEVKKRIEECIDYSWEKYKAVETEDTFTFDQFGQSITLVQSDILYFETSDISNKISVYVASKGKSGVFQFFGSLDKVGQNLNDDFFRCHQSYIVNVNHIQRIDVSNKMVYLTSSEKLPVSKRNLKSLRLLLLFKGIYE